MTTLNQPHNPGCLKQYAVLLDKPNRRAFPLPIYRQRWDCPACATNKLGDITEHLAARNETLCWGVWSKAKANMAKRRGLGYMTIGYADDVKMMVAESHLYEPQQPALTVIQQLIYHTAERTVSRVGWSDNWRPESNGDPLRWAFIDTKSTDLAAIKAGMERAGIVDGRFRNQDVDELRSKIEQILNGVTF